MQQQLFITATCSTLTFCFTQLANINYVSLHLWFYSSGGDVFSFAIKKGYCTKNTKPSWLTAPPPAKHVKIINVQTETLTLYP
jgi:hypothetical protein